jgi:hypothetical protein
LSHFGAQNLPHGICGILYCLAAFDMRFLPQQPSIHQMLNSACNSSRLQLRSTSRPLAMACHKFGAQNLPHGICGIEYCLAAFDMRFLPQQASIHHMLNSERKSNWLQLRSTRRPRAMSCHILARRICPTEFAEFNTV